MATLGDGVSAGGPGSDQTADQPAESSKDAVLDKTDTIQMMGDGYTLVRMETNPSKTNPNSGETSQTGAQTGAQDTLPGSSIESLIVSAKRKSPRPKPKSPISEPSFVCEHCGKSWTSNYKLRVHMRVHTKEKPYKCDQCNTAFTQKYDCDRHVKAHQGEVRTYDCEVCGRSLASSSSLAKHMTIHTGVKKFKCQRCGKAFPTNGDLTKHVRVHTGEKPYTCDVCGRAFAESSSRNRHRMTHTGAKPHKCQFCFEAFLRPDDLKRHVERRHTKESEYTYQIPDDQGSGVQTTEVPVLDLSDIRTGKVSLNDGEIFLEEVMGEDGEMVYVVVSQEAVQKDKSNVLAVALDKNEKEEDKNAMAVAELIESLDTGEELETTDQPVPENQSEEKGPEKELPKKMIDYIVPPPRRRALPEEEYVFSTGSSAVAAQLVSDPVQDTEPETEFMCSSCDETFTDAKTLHIHLQEHLSNDKKKRKRKSKPSLLARETYECPHCDKRYSSQQSLIAHMRRHSWPKQDRKYECSTCTWKFPTLYKLTAHLRSHSEARPYKCPYCDKAYKARGDLRRHVAAHIDPEQAKQYLCSICGAALASTSSLKKHLNIHSGTRNFPCNLCTKSFYSKGDLDKHFRIHTGDKPYKCGVCQRAFAESSTRNSHQRLHSGEKRFECTVCHKRFNRSGDLNRHTRQHTGERRYKCPNCEVSLLDADALAAHKGSFLDQTTGQWRCKKPESSRYEPDQRESVDIVTSLYQGDKDLYQDKPGGKDASLYGREPYRQDKMDLLYPRDKEMTSYPDEKDIPFGYEREKVDVYARDVQNQYYRPTAIEFPNPTLYQRPAMDFPPGFDQYQRTGAPPSGGGQREEGAQGTYRYGFGGTISVVE